MRGCEGAGMTGGGPGMVWFGGGFLRRESRAPTGEFLDVASPLVLGGALPLILCSILRGAEARNKGA